MDKTKDSGIWDYTIQYGFIIITRDDDYNDLSLLKGFPPKVIWIRRGNCSTKEIEQLLRAAGSATRLFERDKQNGILSLT